MKLIHVVVACGIGASGATTAFAAGQAAAVERYEVASIKRVRPTLVNTIDALKKGDAARARDAFEAYDTAWNGIEVYINTRDRDMYNDLEKNYQTQDRRGVERGDARCQRGARQRGGDAHEVRPGDRDDRESGAAQPAVRRRRAGADRTIAAPARQPCDEGRQTSRRRRKAFAAFRANWPGGQGVRQDAVGGGLRHG